jgi:hypothetical protein
MIWTFPVVGVLVILALFAMLFCWREEPAKTRTAQGKVIGMD